jgi:hypothetical protein
MGGAGQRHNEEPLVNFVIVGPGKTGTTWMYEVLSASQGVRMAAAKETMYFDANFARGVAWYHSLIPAGPGDAVGEVSNSYLADPAVPERIAAYSPSMRVVTCVRDPVERAFSNYLFWVRNDQFRGSFEQAIDQRPDLITHGMYGQHVERYLGCFPADQLLVLDYRELGSDPRGFALRLLGFIGATADALPAVVDEQVLPASRARNRVAAGLVKRAAVIVRRAGAPQLVTRVKRTRVQRVLYRPYGDDQRPRVTPETARRLRDLYAGDVEKLEQLTNRTWADRWIDVEGSAA